MDDVLKLKELIDVDTFAPVAKQLQQKVRSLLVWSQLQLTVPQPFVCGQSAAAEGAVLLAPAGCRVCQRSNSSVATGSCGSKPCYPPHSNTLRPARLPPAQAWLMHWSLFVFFNHESGLNALIDLFMQDR